MYQCRYLKFICLSAWLFVFNNCGGAQTKSDEGQAQARTVKSQKQKASLLFRPRRIESSSILVPRHFQLARSPRAKNQTEILGSQNVFEPLWLLQPEKKRAKPVLKNSKNFVFGMEPTPIDLNGDGHWQHFLFPSGRMDMPGSSMHLLTRPKKGLWTAKRIHTQRALKTHYMSLVFDYDGDGDQDAIFVTSQPDYDHKGGWRKDGAHSLNTFFLVATNVGGKLKLGHEIRLGNTQTEKSCFSIMDITGDGRKEVVFFAYNRPGVFALTVSKKGRLAVHRWWDYKRPIARLHTADFNQDGRLDILIEPHFRVERSIAFEKRRAAEAKTGQKRTKKPAQKSFARPKPLRRKNQYTVLVNEGRIKQKTKVGRSKWKFKGRKLTLGTNLYQGNVVDLDGDGHLDLVRSISTFDAIYYRGLGNFNFEEVQIRFRDAPKGFNPRGILWLVKDLDGDGDIDFLVSQTDSALFDKKTGKTKRVVTFSPEWRKATKVTFYILENLGHP